LRLFSFGGYELALAALVLVGFGAIECPPFKDKLFFNGLHNKNKTPVSGSSIPVFSM